MLDKSYIRYKQLQRELEKDEEYLYLHKRRLAAEAEFHDLLKKLRPEQKEIIQKYIGIYGELCQRETELACFLP